MLKTIISIIILALAIPTGTLLAKSTKDEKPIYKKYFPPMLWIIAIATAVFYTLNLTAALTLTFIFVVVLVWWKVR